jgi:hypothetical protein
MSSRAPGEVRALAGRFQRLAFSCQAGGAPLCADLLARSAEEIAAGGPLCEIVAPYHDEPEGRLLPFRLMADIHRWVLSGELPELARHYPSAGGDLGVEGAWPHFREAFLGRASELRERLARPHQHNQVGRSAPLAGGFLLVAGETSLPLRVLEVGASAGFLLRWDHYRDRWWTPGLFDVPPPLNPDVRVVERRGCDARPIDVANPDCALLLRSFVWADLVDHLRMTEDAIDISRRVPAPIDEADGGDWLAEQLAQPRPGVATVVFHSTMVDHSSQSSLAGMGQALLRAAEAATPQAPLAWLRFESPQGWQSLQKMPRYEARLNLWPGGVDRLVATADTNGRHTRWVAGTPGSGAMSGDLG